MYAWARVCVVCVCVSILNWKPNSKHRRNDERTLFHFFIGRDPKRCMELLKKQHQHFFSVLCMHVFFSNPEICLHVSTLQKIDFSIIVSGWKVKKMSARNTSWSQCFLRIWALQKVDKINIIVYIIYYITVWKFEVHNL